MLAAFLSTRARGAAVLIGIPRAGRGAVAPGADDPAHGATRARLDLRLVEAGARLPGRRSSSTARPPAARSSRLAPPAARRGRAGIRADEVRRCAPRRPRPARGAHEPDELDGRIGEGWSGEAPNGVARQRRARRRGSPTAAAAISMLAQPSPGHTPVLVCVGETPQEYEPVWPPTLMMNKATASTTATRRSPGAPRSSASPRVCSTRSPTGSSRRAATCWCSSPCGSTRARATRRRCGWRTERRAQGDRRLRRGARSGRRCRARRAARLARAARSTAASRLMRITAVETRRYRYPLDPPFSRRVGPGPARAPGRDDRPRPHRRRVEGFAAATACPTERSSSAC